MSNPERRITFAPRAERDLRRLDPPIRQRVLDSIERLAAADPTLNIRRLTGRDDWRLRVGDWRVIFRFVEDRHVEIARVLPRGRAYDR